MKKVNTEITNTIAATDEKTQYDEYAKRLLAQKSILAHILVKTVKEFEGMSPKNVISYIEGEPYIGVVPIEPGLTNIEQRNCAGEKIVGFNTENVELREGMIKYDIVFYVRMKNGLTQIIVNIEAQKDQPTSYKILNRGLFYVSRLISSQKERDFVGMNYDDIKSVISIWICMDMEVNCMSHYYLTKEEMLEPYDWQGNMDMIHVVLLGIQDVLPEQDERYELHRLLGTLFSHDMPIKEKLDIIKDEYDIPVTKKLREDVATMCNLSQGIEEKGYDKGYDSGAQTTLYNMIQSMHQKGYSIEEIMEISSLAEEEVREMITEKR